MKERPILMKGPLVLATLEDRKWQTRRIVKPQFTKVWGQGVRHGDDTYSAHVDIPVADGWRWLRCPYGKTGDLLWVRETWHENTVLPLSSRPPGDAVYRADLAADGTPKYSTSWRPSIHMPRWASRLLLEITGVRVERVQEITHDDMRAEGVRPNQEASLLWRESLTENFIALWDTTTTNPAYTWDANPWVWVISYRRIAPE